MCGQKVESSDQTNFKPEWIHTREDQYYFFARLVQLFIFVGAQSQNVVVIAKITAEVSNRWCVSDAM